MSLSPFSTREAVSVPGGSVVAEPGSAAGEVRLRKLHLVRPDLIPYPISFEVYC